MDREISTQTESDAIAITARSTLPKNAFLSKSAIGGEICPPKFFGYLRYVSIRYCLSVGRSSLLYFLALRCGKSYACKYRNQENGTKQNITSTNPRFRCPFSFSKMHAFKQLSARNFVYWKIPRRANRSCWIDKSGRFLSSYMASLSSASEE